jgi:TrmH family RNA methyltransferase
VIRRQVSGLPAVEQALAADLPLRLLLFDGRSQDPRLAALVARARGLGIPVRTASASSRWRLSLGDPAAPVLGLVGPDPEASLPEVLAARGALWLGVGLVYPGNTGFAIRTAEVSGADGIVIDNDFDHAARREAVRAAMRADLFMPVFWERSADVIPAARAAGRRIVAIEDVGRAAPWEVDLLASSLFVVGAERHGIPDAVLADCDTVIRIPMAGFIPSYNLQAAMAVVAGERLRQQARRAGATP